VHEQQLNHDSGFVRNAEAGTGPASTAEAEGCMPEELNVDVILRRPREARASKDVAEAPGPSPFEARFTRTSG